MNPFAILTHAARRLERLVVRPASAHCDTEDGPAVTDGRRALATGNINLALRWVNADAEDELRPLFDRVQAVRTISPDVAGLVDRLFLETLVRLHRAGEGVGFDGIKPSGAEVAPEVLAADRALELGSIEPLRGLVPSDRWQELERRFRLAVSKKNFDPNDLDAARDFVHSYVSFFKYAEGEEHAHHHAHAPVGEHHGHHVH